MKCPNCGNELDKEWKFCPYCSSNIIENDVNDDKNKRDSKEELITIILIILTTIEIMLFFSGFPLSYYYSEILSKEFMGIEILIIISFNVFFMNIYCMVKYPRSIIIKTIFILHIVFLLFMIGIYYLLLQIASSCTCSG